MVNAVVLYIHISIEGVSKMIGQFSGVSSPHQNKEESPYQ
jgi:hypothetical protein